MKKTKHEKRFDDDKLNSLQVQRKFTNEMCASTSPLIL